MPLRRASADVEDRVTSEKQATAPGQDLPAADSEPLGSEPPTIEIPRIPAPSAPVEPDKAGQSVADLLSAVATALAVEDCRAGRCPPSRPLPPNRRPQNQPSQPGPRPDSARLAWTASAR